MNTLPNDTSQHYGQGQVPYPNGMGNRNGMPLNSTIPNAFRYQNPAMPLGPQQGANVMMMPPIGNRAMNTGGQMLPQRPLNNPGIPPTMRMNMVPMSTPPIAQPTSPYNADMIFASKAKLPGTPGHEMDLASLSDYSGLSNPYSFPLRANTPNSLASQSSEFTMHSEDFPALPGSGPIGSGSRDLGNVISRNPSSSGGSFKLQTSRSPAPTDHPEMQISQAPFFMRQQDKPNDAQDLKLKPMPDRYGLLGLLNVIRMSEQDLNTLSVGSDLTTLGLNLNSSETLYSTFASPWHETPARKEPEYRIPSCYYHQPPLPVPTGKISTFSDETLFYIFLAMARESLQDASAQELYNRGWRYHKEFRAWLTRDPDAEVTAKTANYERGTYIIFDYLGWEKVRKELILVYDQLEERPAKC